VVPGLHSNRPVWLLRHTRRAWYPGERTYRFRGSRGLVPANRLTEPSSSPCRRGSRRHAAHPCCFYPDFRDHPGGGAAGPGTWQGYLVRHRRRPGRRTMIVHVWGTSCRPAYWPRRSRRLPRSELPGLRSEGWSATHIPSHHGRSPRPHPWPPRRGHGVVLPPGPERMHQAQSPGRG
jgi:hypothetical protein